MATYTLSASRPPSESFRDLTLIVPTLNEEQTMPLLLESLSLHYPGATVLVADDDSRDRTRAIAEEFGGPLRVRVLHRKEGVKGLTASVVDAIKVVDTPHFVVMDADLQHPPEAVLEVYKHASNGADIAVGSRIRYDSFTAGRRLMSKGARALTRSYLKSKRKPLVDDPMSGFFGGKTRFARAIIEKHESRFELPGFKVLVDLLKFSPPGTRVAEVPYEFAKRAAGSSKMALRHTAHLLRQLGPFGKVAAYALLSLTSATFWKFAAVGLSGVAVNQGLLFLTHGVLAAPLILASLLAIEGALLWNFFWNDKWSFAGKGRGIAWAHRLLRFNSHCALGAVLNAAILFGLVQVFGLHYLVANLVGIAAAMSFNWALSQAWTWSEEEEAETA